jgi:AbrB family looped-hinge helix DNA binding protein
MSDAFDITIDNLLNYDEEKEKLRLPPKGKHLFGTVTVGSKGQIVLPKKAREIFGIEPGDSLLLLGDEEQGLALMKTDDMLRFVNAAMEGNPRKKKYKDEK